jgi:hypothetical protein
VRGHLRTRSRDREPSGSVGPSDMPSKLSMCKPSVDRSSTSRLGAAVAHAPPPPPCAPAPAPTERQLLTSGAAAVSTSKMRTVLPTPGLPGRFHPQLLNKNGRDTGKSQSKRAAYTMETPHSRVGALEDQQVACTSPIRSDHPPLVANLSQTPGRG